MAPERAPGIGLQGQRSAAPSRLQVVHNSEKVNSVTAKVTTEIRFSVHVITDISALVRSLQKSVEGND